MIERKEHSTLTSRLILVKTLCPRQQKSPPLYSFLQSIVELNCTVSTSMVLYHWWRRGMVTYFCLWVLKQGHSILYPHPLDRWDFLKGSILGERFFWGGSCPKCLFLKGANTKNKFLKGELHHQYRHGEYSFSYEEYCKTSFLKGTEQNNTISEGI